MASVNNVLESVREDDFIKYFLFPDINTNDEKEQEALLSKILEKANKIIENFTDNYLWHKDEFKLSPRTSISNSLGFIERNKEPLPPHLYGVSHYGDNIEDEWFMVFLLLQLTKEMKGLIARVYDVDGEFLLIEAADYLPSWANPETCENRVYLYDGDIHLIPNETSEDTELSVTSALSVIREDPTKTLASPDIQNCIKNKISGYPAKIRENLHHVTVYVPVGVAALLREKPNLIAPAVHSFCNRDSVDLNVCRAMKYFPPESRVKRRVAFTKCLYAMLKHSKYVPDRRTGWNLPPQSSGEFKPHSLGVKLACGFEILASQATPSASVESDKAWHNYLKSLTERGYFRGLLEHSVEYNNLLNKAKEYYVEHRDSMRYSPAIGQEILRLTRVLDCDVEQFRKEESCLPKDEDETWLDISPEELDKMLQERYGQKKTFSVNNNTDPASFTEKISSFLNHVSDLDGAEFPDREDDSPVRPPRRKNKSKVSFSQDTKTTQQSTNNKINFDPNSFACAVQNILNFAIPEDDSWDLDSGSDMSEYEEDNYVKDQSYEEVKTKMQQYMEEMDKELAQTTIGDSFVKKKNGDSFDDIESFKPVDIDVNALKNILESYRAQLGEAGPSSNLLGPMGVSLDAKEDMDMA
ncbi:ecdysoneless cell cycle regulator [Leptinotarsa decemlineata]|uniref:ecdysoneless cell cycle regulator n=1 Tax=Leptinotarsa decemlineata TaxID=7539 RepID=UPI003D307575